MHILAIDTATNSGGAALGRNSEVIGLVMMKTPLRYAETILPLIDFLLGQHSLTIQQIDCFAVTTGPGSFTGVRVGLATVKGFCQALDRPVVGISTLAALAYRFRSVCPRVAPMIDARRQQIYGALYQIKGQELEVKQEESVLSPTQWLRGLPGDDYLLVGDATQLYRSTVESILPEARVLDTDNRVLEELCQLGYLGMIQGKTLSGEALKAHYVRPSDARKNP